MKKYIVLLEKNASVEEVVRRLQQINSTSVLRHYADMLQVETEAPLGYLETVPGIKSVEEDVLYK